MVARSAGVLAWHGVAGRTRVFLGHMGGPMWARKDEASWSIPKGLFDPAVEAAQDAARREFTEETGLTVDAPLAELGDFRVSSGKVLTVFTCHADHMWRFVGSNSFEMEWPPRSGRTQSFPEIDRAGWFSLDEARVALVKGQRPVLDALECWLGGRTP